MKGPPPHSDQGRLLRRDVLYQGKVLDLFVDRLALPSGGETLREVAHHPGGATIVPLFPDGTVLLVEQLRYPLQKRLLELPAGKIDPGEQPEEAARRELEEETGYRAGQLTLLTSFYTSPGFCDEELHLYLAQRLEALPSGPRPQEGEASMTLHRMKLQEALALVAQRRINDAKTIIGLLLAHQQSGDA